MNLPNKLTVLRLILTAIFVAVLAFPPFPGQYSIATILFIIAAITDFLDGYLARKYNLITNFGKLMDPLADKVLMCAGFVVLTEFGLLEGWITVTILAREFLVTGLRLVAAGNGQVVAADKLGKQKTIWQIVLVLYLLVFMASNEWFFWLRWIFDWTPTSPQIAGQILKGIALILTVWSGVGYLMKNRHVFAEK